MTIAADARPHVTSPPHQPGDESQPRWVRPALVGLLVATAVLYLWALGSSGWANNYYAAAVQAGTQSWKAWLFGSLDAGNAITVDKPPAAMWVMALSGRLFGFSAFTMLLPQALMGVGAVALLYATVRRGSGPAAGLIAGTVLALTPVAALMFRFNNPDALLVLLLVAAAYCMMRATETASTRWIALAGCVLGFAFLTKMLQAFLVVPGFALAFLVAAPVGMWKRIGKLAVGAVAMTVSAGWYIALVSLWPAASRPYIGGSSDNSLLQLALGYNGIDRVVGREGHTGAEARDGLGDAGAHVLRWTTGNRSSVRPVDGHASVLAVACGSDWFGRGTVAHPARGPHRRCSCGAAAVGRLAAGDLRRVQLHGRHHSSLLHGCAGTGDRGVGRDLGPRAVAGQTIRGGANCRWQPCPLLPAFGRSSFWTACRTGGRHCAGSSWPEPSSRRRRSRSVRIGAAVAWPYWLPLQQFWLWLRPRRTPSRPWPTCTAVRWRWPVPSRVDATVDGLGHHRAGLGSCGQSGARASRRRGRQSLGGSHYRIVHCEQPRTEDRSFRHGDRRIQRNRQRAHAGAVPGLRRRP